MSEERLSAEQLINDKQALKELMDSRGWRVLMEIADSQIAVRGSWIFGPIPQDKVLEQEFTKGELAGIKLFQSMPLDAIESLELDILQAQMDEVEEKTDGS